MTELMDGRKNGKNRSMDGQKEGRKERSEKCI